MLDARIKQYYNYYFEQIEQHQQQIDITKQVMNRIVSSQKKIRQSIMPRFKFALIIVAIIVVTLGCSLYVTKEYLGPNGNLSWKQVFMDRTTKEDEQVYAIFNDLSLNEGDVVDIILDGSETIYTFQKPTIVNSLLELSDLQTVQVRAFPHSIAGLQFNYADYIKQSGKYELGEKEGVIDYEEFSEYDNYKGYRMRLNSPTESDFLLMNLRYGSIEDGIVLSINQDNASEAIDNKDILYQVTYFDSSLADNTKTIDVNGYQGAMTQGKNFIRYEIVYHNNYIILEDRGNHVTEEIFEELVTTMFVD